MPRLHRFMLIAAALAIAASTRSASGAPLATPTVVLPETLEDARGKTIDVARLAQTHALFVVTLKATRCPVCQRQLVRLRQLLPRLRSCGATFIVLSPPPARDLLAIQESTGFPYPFVVDADLGLARAAGLLLPPDQIEPAILAVDETRAIVWTQRGRSAAYFGDEELLAYLKCGPLSDA